MRRSRRKITIIKNSAIGIAKIFMKQQKIYIPDQNKNIYLIRIREELKFCFKKTSKNVMNKISSEKNGNLKYVKGPGTRYYYH